MYLVRENLCTVLPFTVHVPPPLPPQHSAHRALAIVSYSLALAYYILPHAVLKDTPKDPYVAFEGECFWKSLSSNTGKDFGVCVMSRDVQANYAVHMFTL